eukprot:jgi/Botrbrau1/9758/Bobra.85_1s0009.1
MVSNDLKNFHLHWARITFKAFSNTPAGLPDQCATRKGAADGGEDSQAELFAVLQVLVEPDTEQSVSLQEPPANQATARNKRVEPLGGGGAYCRKRVLSGVQPTGLLHLGNYLGAIRNWVALQELYGGDTFFCVVDMHAITLPHEPKDLRESDAALCSAGTSPRGSTRPRPPSLYNRIVPAHAELTWLLMCYTPIGWLRRMIQFKEKSAKAGAEEGEDQKQHIELARDIAERFNSKFGGNKWKKLGGAGEAGIFKVPNIFIPPAGPASCPSL